MSSVRPALLWRIHGYRRPMQSTPNGVIQVQVGIQGIKYTDQ
jgi:hypothetical protein